MLIVFAIPWCFVNFFRALNVQGHIRVDALVAITIVHQSANCRVSVAKQPRRCVIQYRKTCLEFLSWKSSSVEALTKLSGITCCSSASHCCSLRASSGQLRDLARGADTKIGTDSVQKCWLIDFFPAGHCRRQHPPWPTHLPTPICHVNIWFGHIQKCRFLRPSTQVTRSAVLRSQQPGKISTTSRHHLHDSLLEFFPTRVAQIFHRDSLAIRDCSNFTSLMRTTRLVRLQALKIPRLLDPSRSSSSRSCGLHVPDTSDSNHDSCSSFPNRSSSFFFS